MRKIFTLLFVLCSWMSNAQTGIVKGTVIHEDTKLPYLEVSVSIGQAKVATSTNEKGEYLFSGIPYGTYDMKLAADGIEDEKISITVSGPVNNIEPIELKSTASNTSSYQMDNSAVNAEDATSEDENTSSSTGQNVSSVLNASRDPFLSAATFGWGSYFYRIRGYENDHSVLFMNGVPMNDLEEGGVFFNSWSGLNDVFRGRSVTMGLAANDYNFGGLGLNTELDASASNQRKGTRVTYTATNRSYRNRIMLTHNSGLMKNGWAYSFSLSRRWAQNGQIKGTFYDAFAYFGAIEKRFKKHGINFMVVGSPIKRGKNGPATQEAFNLAETNFYNPNWGYQKGKVRNSRVLTTHSPLFVLTHDAKLSDRTTLTTALAYQTGETANSRLDWYNAADPRPDYYRYFPSYVESLGGVQEATSYIKANKDAIMQVDWDNLYEANLFNKKSGYNRSVYIVSEDVEASKKWNAAVNLETSVNDHISLYSGINFQKQVNHNFQRVADLMGGDYWENINQFANRIPGIADNANMFNVNDTDVKRKKGDHYGYDYNIHFNKAAWFGQGVFTYNKFDFFLAAELGYTSFYRHGNYKHGLYQNNSFGNSSTNTFFTSKAKGGITYKLNGRNYIYANGSIGNKAPYVDNVIISPRTRNLQISNPTTEKFQSAEVGYLLRTPGIKARLTFFITDVKDAADIKRFYGDDSASFLNMAMQGINKRYTGIEAGAEIKVSPTLSVNLAAAFTQAFYTSRPYINVYSDNDTLQLNNSFVSASDTVYMKNYYVPAGPQSAFQASLNYRAKRFWFASISFNYLGSNWIDFAPTRRTIEGVDPAAYQSEKWQTIIDQQKIPAFYTVDLFGGKSFKVNKYIKKAGNNTFLNLTLGLNNVLNNKNIRLYGFENLRYDKERPEIFPARFAYALGTTYFVNLALRF